MVRPQYKWTSNHINGCNRGLAGASKGWIENEFVYKMGPFIEHVCKEFKYKLELCIKKNGNNNFFG